MTLTSELERPAQSSYLNREGTAIVNREKMGDDADETTQEPDLAHEDESQNSELAALKRREVKQAQAASLQASEVHAQDQTEERSVASAPEDIADDKQAAASAPEAKDRVDGQQTSSFATDELRAAAVVFVQRHHRRYSARRGGVMIDEEEAAEAARRARGRFHVAQALAAFEIP